jgi:hypothetical protein
MLARNSLLWRLAVSSSRLFASISRNRRAFWIASADCVANGLEELDDLGREVARRVAVDREAAEQPLVAQQRHREDRAVAVLDQHRAHAALVALLVARVAHDHRLAGDRELADGALALADRHRAQRVDDLGGQVVRRVQVEGLARLVVFPHRPAIDAGEHRRARDDRREHGFEVERRAHRLPDLAERAELAHRLGQLVEQRTFSIAMTAWSANVVTSSTCLSVNGSTRVFHSTITPSSVSPASIGTARSCDSRPASAPRLCR